jgi:hypothetical protein
MIAGQLVIMHACSTMHSMRQREGKESLHVMKIPLGHGEFNCPAEFGIVAGCKCKAGDADALGVKVLESRLRAQLDY